MKAVLLTGERQVEVVSLPDPAPAAREVVIQIRASGLCGSDLHAYRGPRIESPHIAGHEPAGTVVAVGADVPQHWLGTSVMVHHYIGCEECDQCRSGWTQLCRRGSLAMGATAPGSHAEFIKVPVSTILPMPPGLSYVAAAAISCGTGTAWGALQRLNIRAEETLVIFGQGPVGLAATQLAVAMGVRVIALDISPTRLETAMHMGAAHSIDPSTTSSVVEAIKDLTEGRGAAKSLETSGASSAAQEALACLDTWGTACWVGLGSTIHFDLTEHLYRQVTGLLSWTMSVPAMEACARFVVQRSIDVDALFSERWDLDAAPNAYELFDKQTGGKAAFTPRA